MPLFFIISGYLFDSCKWQTSQCKDFVKSRFKSYMYPYICIYLTHILLFFFSGIFINGDYLQRIPRYFVGLFLARGGERMPLCTPIWFLPCVFLGSLIYFFASRAPVCLILPGTFILGVAFTVCGIQLPWHFEISLSTGCFFMAIGNLMKKKKTVSCLSCTAVALMLLAGCICAEVNDFVDLNNNRYGNWWLFLGSSLLLSAAVFYICFHITKNLTWLSVLGKETVVIMGFHYGLAALLRKTAKAFISNKYLLGTAVFIGSCPLLLMLVCLSWLFKKHFRRRK